MAASTKSTNVVGRDAGANAGCAAAAFGISTDASRCGDGGRNAELAAQYVEDTGVAVAVANAHSGAGWST